MSSALLLTAKWIAKTGQSSVLLLFFLFKKATNKLQHAIFSDVNLPDKQEIRCRTFVFWGCCGNLQNVISMFSVLGHGETWMSRDWSKLWVCAGFPLCDFVLSLGQPYSRRDRQQPSLWRVMENLLLRAGAYLFVFQSIIFPFRVSVQTDSQSVACFLSGIFCCL